MAHLICGATGNLTSSGTWRTVDSTALITEGGSTATTLTTTSQNSANFTPGAVDVDALAVRLLSRGAGTPTNTLTLVLYDVTSSSAVVTLAIPVADLPPSNNADLCRGGWVMFSLGGTVSLEAGKNYQVRMNLNNTSTAVAFITNGTAANWQHMLRTTTGAAPAAADNMWIIGLWTASATWTVYTVTQDQTTTGTVYGSNPGSADTNPEARSGIGVYRSSLVWPTTSSTAIAIAGNLNCGAYSTVSMGTTSSPIQRGYTAVLQFNTTTLYGPKINAGGYFSAAGESPTLNKDVNWTLLVENATSGSTSSLVVQDDTGWTSGSTYFVGTTRRGVDDYAQYTLSADAGTNSLSHSAALSANYKGSTGGYKFAAPIALTTYNVTIQSDAATRSCYIRGAGNATIGMHPSLHLKWVRGLYTYVLSDIVSNSSVNKCLLDYQKTTILGSPGIRFSGAPAGAYQVKDLVCINAGGNWMFYFDHGNGTDLSSHSLENLISICGSGGGGHYIQYGNWSVCRGFRSNGGNAAYLSIPSNNDGPGSPPSDYLSGSAFTGPGGTGCIQFSAQAIRDITITNVAAIGSSASLYFGGMNLVHNVKFKGCTFFSSSSAYGVVDFQSFDCNMESLTLDECTCGGASEYSQVPPRLLWIGSNQEFPVNVKFLNCVFSNSHCTPPSQAAVYMNSVGASTNSRPMTRVLFVNPTGLNPSSGAVGTTGAYVNQESYVAFMNWNGTAGDNRTYFPWYSNGVTALTYNVASRRTNNTVYNTAAPSEQLLPVTTASKFESSVKRFAVTSGSTSSIAVYVRKDSAYDGAAPRLILRRHDIAGYNSDQVLATHSAAADAWEQLSSSLGAVAQDAVLEVVVDCDGTTGSVYVDDWSAT